MSAEWVFMFIFAKYGMNYIGMGSDMGINWKKPKFAEKYKKIIIKKIQTTNWKVIRGCNSNPDFVGTRGNKFYNILLIFCTDRINENEIIPRYNDDERKKK